ncbi:MAG: Rpn family recombination-promoting nuclease/putative transposase [Spirochaetaceae bacterium]|jgi:predicted transposase/invertase (TIGR01784 family)|nr:Rpn family recombination-promoting nuclease/putative transposase [Spirochaetaceae bacterium]
MGTKENRDIPAILPVKSDLIFRLLFADERNKEELLCLLKAILQIPEDDYDEIEIADPHLLPEYIEDKYAIIDVKLYTKSKKIVHIEIQLKITPELRKRIIFYNSKLITEQIGSGGNYAEIQNVISIIILEKNLITESPKYHHCFRFYDSESHIELTDLVEVHTIELDKLPVITDGSQLYDWAKFINAETEEELTMIADRNQYVEKAVVKLHRLSSDEQTRYFYEMREKARRDIESQERWARIEGQEEGRKEGRREGENRLSKLNTILLKDKRYDLLEKISNDENFRNEMYSKYDL